MTRFWPIPMILHLGEVIIFSEWFLTSFSVGSQSAFPYTKLVESKSTMRACSQPPWACAARGTVSSLLGRNVVEDNRRYIQIRMYLDVWLGHLAAQPKLAQCCNQHCFKKRQREGKKESKTLEHTSLCSLWVFELFLCVLFGTLVRAGSSSIGTSFIECLLRVSDGAKGYNAGFYFIFLATLWGILS